MVDRQMLLVCLERKKWWTFATDTWELREHSRCETEVDCKDGEWKISRRVLERIGYVMKRKTVLFRKQVLRNLGINYSEVEWLKNSSNSLWKRRSSAWTKNRWNRWVRVGCKELEPRVECGTKGEKAEMQVRMIWKGVQEKGGVDVAWKKKVSGECGEREVGVWKMLKGFQCRGAGCYPHEEFRMRRGR